MKKLKYALFSLALLSCGSTPKNEISKIVPQPQRDTSQADFEASCLRDETGNGRGVFNSERTICRKPQKIVSFGRVNDKDFVQDPSVAEVNLGSNLGAGAMIYGTYEGTSLPPEVTLDGVVIARGNISPPYLTERPGTVRLATFKGAYKSLNYVLATCSSRTAASVPCENF